MKVVFLEEVEGTARTGDVKNVADGFARNFLLPRKLAAPATQHYITIADARATKEAKKQDRLDEEAKTHLLPKVDGQAYTTEVRVGDEGKLFGSVSARDIAELVQQGTGIEVEHRQIDLKEPIRELGSYDITVKLTRNVLATVSLSVEPIGGMPEEEEAEEEAGDEAEAAEDGAEAAEAETSEAEASAEGESEESTEEVEASTEVSEPEASAEAAESVEEPEAADEEETSDESAADETVAESADEEPQEPEEEKSETE
jgi:large subunit ribosomal protein L9